MSEVSQDFAGKVRKSILHNDKVLIRRHQAILWRDLDRTMDYCVVLGHLCSTKLLKTVQQQTLTKTIQFTQKGFENLSTDEMIRFSELYLDRSAQEGMAFSEIFLGSSPGEYRRSIKLFDSLNQCRAKLWPQLKVIKDQEGAKANLQLMGVAMMFGASIIATSQTWRNLLLSVANGTQEAYTVMNQMMYFYGTTLTAISFVPLSQWRHGNRDPVSIYRTVAGSGSIELPVQDELLPAIGLFCSSSVERMNKINGEYKPLIDWFLANEESLLLEEYKMLEEILDKPKYALRPEGLDKIKVDLHPTLTFYVQLFPRSFFPASYAKVWVQWPGSGWMAEGLELEPDTWPSCVESYHENWYQQQQVTDRIYRFCSLYCLWLITTGKTKKAEQVGEKNVRVNGARKAVSSDDVKAIVPVRAHLRKLVSGAQASDDARQKALSGIGTLPPDGMTFVGGYDRGVSIFETKESIQAFEAIPALSGISFSFREFGFSG